jgi:hypothetical protein
MKLFSYIITSDSGFAPNPFFGFCTLATCKPRIRSAARAGDWIAGFGSARTVGPGRLVYAMQVAEVLSFVKYDRDPRFQRKKPRLNGTAQERCGDNIYYRGASGEWRQRRNQNHGPRQFDKDVGRGRQVLVGRRFYYFGSNARPVPPRFRLLVPTGRGHRSRFRGNVVDEFIRWLGYKFPPGRHGRPWETAQNGASGWCCPRPRRVSATIGRPANMDAPDGPPSS